MKFLRLSLLATAVGFFVLNFGSHTVFALNVPPKPIDIPVVDQTKTLTNDQKQKLAQKIAAERSATNNQIAVLIISSLEDDSLEDYSLNVARTWGIGGNERNSGVLLLVAKDDRRLRIEVGYGLEGALTDIRSNQIIRDRIKPFFQDGKYYEGINSGLDGIIAAVHGESDPNIDQKNTAVNEAAFPWEALLYIGGVALIWLGSILGRTKSWWAGGVIGGIAGIVLGFFFGFLFIGIASIIGLTLFGLLFDKIVSKNFQSHAGNGDKPSWWAGGGFLGGGGFGGFGGGGFGGGGSSGDW